MSRYPCKLYACEADDDPADPNTWWWDDNAIIGWDDGLETCFLQSGVETVIDGCDTPILWLGADYRAYIDPDELIADARAHGYGVEAYDGEDLHAMIRNDAADYFQGEGIALPASTPIAERPKASLAHILRRIKRMASFKIIDVKDD